MADQMTGLLSPFLRARRVAAVRPFVARGRVLDIGCGTGQLAGLVESSRYTGVDQDEVSVASARRKWPAHRFLTTAEFSSEPREEAFDLIVGLAVIEHIEDPIQWLTWLRTLLAPTGQILLTTPHPFGRRVHDLGGRIGVFSREAAEEHHAFLDRRRMAVAAESSGLQLVRFQPFLLGANQLFVLEPRPSPRRDHPARR